MESLTGWCGRLPSLFENIGVTQDGFNMLSKKIVINDSRQAKPLVIKNNAMITFDNVSFAYSGRTGFLSIFPEDQKHMSELELWGVLALENQL